MPAIKLTLYGRETCHLCHDMLQDLRVWGAAQHLRFEITHIDIDEQPELLNAYANMIPVLCDQTGQILCFGRFDARPLETYILLKTKMVGL